MIATRTQSLICASLFSVGEEFTNPSDVFSYHNRHSYTGSGLLKYWLIMVRQASLSQGTIVVDIWIEGYWGIDWFVVAG